MKLLLDTNCLIWTLLDHPRLTAQARQAIQAAESVHFSTASLWEIGLKWRKGKINLPPRRAYEQAIHDGLLPLPIRVEDMIHSCELADSHPDPFDRLFLAQATLHNFLLLTSDAALAKEGGGHVLRLV